MVIEKTGQSGNSCAELYLVLCITSALHLVKMLTFLVAVVISVPASIIDC